MNFPEAITQRFPKSQTEQAVAGESAGVTPATHVPPISSRAGGEAVPSPLQPPHSSSSPLVQIFMLLLDLFSG